VTQGIQDWFEQLRDAPAVLKFFRHALHFAMGRDENLIDRGRIERAVSFRYLLHDADCFVIAKFGELDEDVRLLNRLALQSDRIKRHDRIGDLGSATCDG
jgi:hypothetical protein